MVKDPQWSSLVIIYGFNRLPAMTRSTPVFTVMRRVTTTSSAHLRPVRETIHPPNGGPARAASRHSPNAPPNRSERRTTTVAHEPDGSNAVRNREPTLPLHRPVDCV